MDAILLARVSTKEQESIPAQLARLESFIKRQNLNVVKIFEIEESSSKDIRKEYLKMLEFVRNYPRKIAIVTDTIDRLQRSFRESEELSLLMKSGKLDLYFYRENLILNKDSNSSDIIRYDMWVMFAKNYVLQIGDNVKRKIDKKIEDWEWCGPAHIGYINVDEYGWISTIHNRRVGKKDIIPDPNKAHFIKRVYEKYATGNYSCKSIANELYEEWFRAKNWGKVTPSGIHKILENTFYIWLMKIRWQLVPHRYERIISEELYNTCKDIRMGFKRPDGRKGKLDFVVKGLMTCACCGKQLSVYYSKRAKANYVQCHAWRCLHIREEIYLKQISEVLSKLNIDEDSIKEVYERINKKQRELRDYEEKNKKTHTNRLNQIQKAIENAYEDKCMGNILEDTYVSLVDKWKKEETEILEKIQSMTSRDRSHVWSLEYIIELAQKSYKLFECSKINEKREILKTLFSTLQWKWEKLIYKIKEPLEEILFVRK
jgi:site-specific DNA recombinase